MTVRSTMSSIITRLRGLTQTTVDDYTVESATYWSSDHLQDALDLARTDVWREPLYAQTTYNNGTVEYKNYYTNITGPFEQTSGGTAIFYVENGAGSAIGTALYSVDYNTGRIVFDADTTGSAYYLNARAYDLNAAAADVWRQKATYYATNYDFSTDNHSVKKSQVYEHCLKMAMHYEQRSKSGGATFTTLTRNDVAII